MLSYRHGFHAGGAADVLKHSVLIFCLDYLLRKGKPCLFADTHAGAGSYPLGGGFAAKNREWEAGMGRLAAAARTGPVPPLLARYLEFAAPALPGEKVPLPYPGSPAIMARFLRPGDRLVCFELHPGDFISLGTVLGPRAEARREDGLQGLSGLLPPPSRRGCVFVDPSYEMKEDFLLLPAALGGALRRFPGGLYIVWYPLLSADRGPADCGPADEYPSSGGFAGKLMGLYPGNRCRLELRVSEKAAPPANSPRGFYGSGLVIFNPPWTLRPALEEALPFLSSILGEKGGWEIQWEERV